MSDVEDSQKWIDKIMMKTMENLELDVNETRYEVSKSINLIMTTVYYVCLRFKNKTNDQEEQLSMIVKRPVKSINELLNIDLQFHNEILFYQKYIQPNDRHRYAKCYYVNEQSFEDLAIVLENVNERGYYPCPYTYNCPLEYTLTAMRELGCFHGKSYVMKELQREKFFNIVAQLREVRYYQMESNCKAYMAVKSLRGVEYLRKQKYDVAFCDKMEDLLSNVQKIVLKLIEPLEPLSTLCHGDFLLTNHLFKIDKNEVRGVMLIDFALLRYSTPVVDLSTYLFVCCLNEERREKFSDIMHAYHDALIKYLLDAGIQDIEKYSYDALLNDFKRCALFGFFLASHFIPVLLGYIKPDVIVRDLITLGALESAKKQKYLGGERVCKILADILLHLRELGCLKHFVE